MKLSEIATLLHADWQGGIEAEVNGIESLTEAGPEEISFLTDMSHAKQLEATNAAAVIVPKAFDKTGGIPLLKVTDVEAALDQLLDMFAPVVDRPETGIHSSAIVHESARIDTTAAISAQVVIHQDVVIGAGSVVSAGCVLGRGVQIGCDCFLGPNVVINYNCRLGDRVMIHGNSTIGTDGFGYRVVDGRHKKIRHIGAVIIKNDVEIGANSCVDRAKFGKTVIGEGTKIDNLVQVAHNVKIGKHCILVSNSALAGSAELGDYVVLAGQVGIGDHAKIGTGAMIGAQSGIYSRAVVEPGAKLHGMPPRDAIHHHRLQVLMNKLPEMAKDIKLMKRQLEKRAESTDHS